MPIGLIALDENEDSITCNSKAGTILNIESNDICNREAGLVLPKLLQKIMADLSDHSSLMEEDLQLADNSKENKTLEIIAASLTADGISIGEIMLLRDVTAQRKLENEVVKSRHLTSIDSLAGAVAHEIRNQLSSIKGFAVYFRELFHDKEDYQMADIMIDEVEYLNRVITQLIEFARPLQLKRGKTFFTEMLQHTLNLIA
jgi:two-component system sensor histidine kinase HydH